MSKKTALIVGISGQDGSYLAEHLLKNNYEVFGTSRDKEMNTFSGLQRLGIINNVQLKSMSLVDFRSVLKIISDVKPDEIYNLAAQSSVSLSFEHPFETMESITIGTLNILEIIRMTNPGIKFYNASSSESFGDTPQGGADEETPFKPKSPYAVAKTSAHHLVSSYRSSYQLFAVSGILFNHESPLRPVRFVTQKIIRTAADIKAGKAKKLKLGNVSIIRDWGWAPEFVVAMHKMLQLKEPEDFVIATGKSISLEEFVDITFKKFDLDYKKYVEFDKSFKRPNDIQFSKGNPQKAVDKLNWKAKFDVEKVIELMIDDTERK
ncbi:gdp-mannose 4,6 dehydratase [hydrocarbon metagenome]|uniref:GDP-mannose 4,6-dehydratase n=1 Tax=hydrocarbon metagenome TaxID=938273 RepID=A0A0W8FVC2_9ZZZZ